MDTIAVVNARLGHVIVASRLIGQRGQLILHDGPQPWKPGKYPGLSVEPAALVWGPAIKKQFTWTNELVARQEPRLLSDVLPGRSCVPYISRDVSPNNAPRMFTTVD